MEELQYYFKWCKITDSKNWKKLSSGQYFTKWCYLGQDKAIANMPKINTIKELKHHRESTWLAIKLPPKLNNKIKLLKAASQL
jgi:peptidyl-tRNA hydrolase